jgi:hypothetical protein
MVPGDLASHGPRSVRPKVTAQHFRLELGAVA